MRKIVVMLTGLVFLLACEKSENVRCEDLKSALRADQEDVVKRMVTDLAADLKFRAGTDDPDLHRQHFLTLIDRLRKCGLMVSDYCYECVYTLPAISEIHIVISASSGIVTRVIDLADGDHNRFVCINMH